MHDRLAAVILVVSSILLPSSFLHAAEIRGKVISVDRGEPLGRVQVAILQTQREAVATAITANDGGFFVEGLAPGHYTLRLNAVGYRLITVEFSLATDEANKEFDITLVPIPLSSLNKGCRLRRLRAWRSNSEDSTHS
jgi:hypothetical protein